MTHQSMKREFLLNILFLLTANLLIKPFYLFGIDRGVQNAVTESEYGLYFALFNFTFLFQIVSDFGLQNYNNRNISQHRQLLPKYFANIVLLKGGLALVYLVLVLAFGWLAGYALPYFSLLLVIAGNQLLASWLLYLRSNISGLGHYRLDSLLSVTDRLLLILLCGALLWGDVLPGPFRIEWFVWAQTIALGSTALLAYAIVRRQMAMLSFRFNRAMLLLLLKQSAPYALSVFLMTAYYRLDGIMIERMLPNGAQEAGLYASAYRLYEAFNMVGFLFASLLLPIFARMLAERQEVEGLALMSFRFIGAGALSLVAGIYFHRTGIMELLYDSGSVYSGRLLFYLTCSFAAVAGTYIFGTLLVANGNLRPLNYVFSAGLALNLGLNLLLIPDYRAEGAAIATCATQGFVLAAELWLARRLLGIRFGVGLWLRFAALLGLLLFIGGQPAAWLFEAWPGQFLLVLVSGMGLSIGLGLVRWRDGVALWGGR